MVHGLQLQSLHNHIFVYGTSTGTTNNSHHHLEREGIFPLPLLSPLMEAINLSNLNLGVGLTLPLRNLALPLQHSRSVDILELEASRSLPLRRSRSRFCSRSEPRSDYLAMNNELDYDEFPPYFRVYKDGRVERLSGYEDEFVPPSVDDPSTGVSSKDVLIVPETGVSARLYLPKITHTQEQKKKLPLLIYYHGGAFCVRTAFTPRYHKFLNSLVAEANVIAVSVEYRRAPEHYLPVAYEDSWEALQWVLSHSNEQGPETWLNDHADFSKVFVAGDSAGATITQNMAIRSGINGIKLLGVVLIHPYFWGVEPVGSEGNDMNVKERVDSLWLTLCPSTTDNDDPLINPATDPNLSNLGCNRVLVFVAEKDILRDRGWFYYETLRKSGWGGVVEILESEGEGHVFYLINPSSGKAVEFTKRLVSFLNQDRVVVVSPSIS